MRNPKPRKLKWEDSVALSSAEVCQDGDFYINGSGRLEEAKCLRSWLDKYIAWLERSDAK